MAFFFRCQTARGNCVIEIQRNKYNFFLPSHSPSFSLYVSLSLRLERKNSKVAPVECCIWILHLKIVD